VLPDRRGRGLRELPAPDDLGACPVEGGYLLVQADCTEYAEPTWVFTLLTSLVTCGTSTPRARTSCSCGSTR